MKQTFKRIGACFIISLIAGVGVRKGVKAVVQRKATDEDEQIMDISEL